MRLLRLEDDGGFSLVEFVSNNIPHYAILSHTWRANNEELTFKDLVAGTGKSKTGYTKIRSIESKLLMTAHNSPRWTLAAAKQGIACRFVGKHGAAKRLCMEAGRLAPTCLDSTGTAANTSKPAIRMQITFHTPAREDATTGRESTEVGFSACVCFQSSTETPHSFH